MIATIKTKKGKMQLNGCLHFDFLDYRKSFYFQFKEISKEDFKELLLNAFSENDFSHLNIWTSDYASIVSVEIPVKLVEKVVTETENW